jgi:hypothetical protein
MLGATTAHALVHPVSIPPKPEELTDIGNRDWKTGVELVKTCMQTHDTATCVMRPFTPFIMLRLGGNFTYWDTADYHRRSYISGFRVMGWITDLKLRMTGISRARGKLTIHSPAKA